MSPCRYIRTYTYIHMELLFTTKIRLLKLLIGVDPVSRMAWLNTPNCAIFMYIYVLTTVAGYLQKV
jgi:hypothetical protein